MRGPQNTLWKPLSQANLPLQEEVGAQNGNDRFSAFLWLPSWDQGWKHV